MRRWREKWTTSLDDALVMSRAKKKQINAAEVKALKLGSVVTFRKHPWGREIDYRLVRFGHGRKRNTLYLQEVGNPKEYMFIRDYPGSAFFRKES